MSIYVALLLAVVFFIELLVVFYIGLKLGKRLEKREAPIPLNDDKQRQLEQYDKGFKAIFSYDVEKALQPKKVT
jgi:hypothetical protein